MPINGEVFKIDMSVAPAIIQLSDGGLVSVKHKAGGFNVQKLNADMTFDGGVQGFSAADYQAETQLYASALAGSGFATAWHKFGVGGGVYTQLHNADNSAHGNAIKLGDYVSDSASDIAITGLKDGGYVAVWEQPNAAGDSSVVYGQMINQDGVKQGDAFRVNDAARDAVNDVKYSKMPAITPLDDGGFAVGWTAYNADAAEGVSKYSIAAQRYSATGAKQGEQLFVNERVEHEAVEAALTALPNGEFVVIYSTKFDRDVEFTYDYYQTNKQPQKIFGQIFDAAGVKQRGEFIVDTFTVGKKYDINVSTLYDGGFVAAWTSLEQDGFVGISFLTSPEGVTSGVYAQKFNADGTRESGEFSVNITDYSNFRTTEMAHLEGMQDQTHLVALADGGFVISYFSEAVKALPNTDPDRGFYGRKFGDGEHQPSVPGINLFVGTAQSDHMNSALHSIVAGSNGKDVKTVIKGYLGDDVIYAGSGAETIYGEEGNDFADGYLGDDLIIDGLGNNIFYGNDNFDRIFTFAGINKLDGGAHEDLLIGGIHADRLIGDSGVEENHADDILIGDSSGMFGGSDYLAGGKGADILMGGKGADIFHFDTADFVLKEIPRGGIEAPANDRDVIGKIVIADIGYAPTNYFSSSGVVVKGKQGFEAELVGGDFRSGVDIVEFANFETTNNANILSLITDTDDGALLIAEGIEILFYDIAKDQISADDFMFL